MDFEDFLKNKDDIVATDIKHAQAVSEEKLADTGRGRYRLELSVIWDRSIQHDFLGQLSFWESSGSRDGNGDTKSYLCPGKSLGINGCSAVIPPKFTNSTQHVCPTCKKAWKAAEVIGEMYARTNVQRWAELIHEHFYSLGGDCDIHLIHNHTSIKTAAEAEQAKQMHGDLLRTARERSRSVYPLARIHKDLAAGADLVARIRAFISA